LSPIPDGLLYHALNRGNSREIVVSGRPEGAAR